MTSQVRPDVQSPESYVIKDGVRVYEHFFELPLDYATSNGATIRVFARQMVPKVKPPTDVDKMPYLLFLQGGPGFETSYPLQQGGFADEIHERGYQTLWLDQRGTGLSTPLSADTLESKNDYEKAAYLKHFRADSIVEDCEAIRKILLAGRSPDEQKWTVMGNSFGGFCALTYLSFHPEGLKEVFLTAGLAPLVNSPDRVYEALIPRIKKRNSIYYEKYPRDVQRVREIASYLEQHDVRLPNGGHLTVIRWQGLDGFGMHGGIDIIHQIVFRAYNDLALFGKLSYKILQVIEQMQVFDGNPLAAILHEPIYCQGHAPMWAAARAIAKHPQFSWPDVKRWDESEPLYFLGEMILPEMFDDYSNLRPLKGAAALLAHDASWSALYDLDRLSKNEVNVTAATYMEDMYLDYGLAQDTASKVRNTEQYITNQLFHNGIYADPKGVMQQLFRLSKRERD